MTTYLWTKVKEVTKKIIENVGYINGLIIEIVATTLLVATSVIASVLLTFKLMIIFAPLTLLFIIFISNMIIFGKDLENQKDKAQINLREVGNNPPSLEDEQPQKILNQLDIFLENVKTFIDNIKNKNLKDEQNCLYSFTLGENDEIIGKYIEEEEDSDKNKEKIDKNVLVSYCLFEYIPLDIKKGIRIQLDNTISDFDIGRKILKGIKDALLAKYNYNFDFYEVQDEPIKVEIEKIENIETIEMKMII